MAAIDPTTNVGRLRLRVGDFSDIPYIPDSVYLSTLEDTGNNLNRAAIKIAGYILGMLSFSGHRKLAQIECWGGEFNQYKEFLMLTIKDPAFMDVSPIPYSGAGSAVHPLIQFASDWNKNTGITQSQQLAHDASASPNDGSTFGILGDASNSTWELT